VSYSVHPSALVEEGAEIGAGTRIWHFSHVRRGAQIGRDCSLGQNTYVAATVQIGDGCKIQNNVSIYDGVRLDDEVFVGPHTAFTNVDTPRAHISRQQSFVPTHIRSRASLGANSTIVCGVEIGPYAMVGAGAVVTRDVAAHALVVGVPARQMGWACRCGRTLVQAEERWSCQECGDQYRTQDGKLSLETRP
jgi:UDP-2-acetamido-3-amino-2,3-dideoxy-glucuronate N-acetyltransferase